MVIRDYMKERCGDYARTKKEFDEEIKTLRTLSDQCEFERALDIGCGDGILTTYIVHVGLAGEAFGIDKDGEGMQKTKEDVQDMRYKVDFEEVKFEDFSVNDEFDLIIFRYSLHHIYPGNEVNLGRCIGNLFTLREVMPIGGVIYIKEHPKVNRFFKFIYDKILDTEREHDWEEYRTIKEWKKILRSCNFHDIKYKRNFLDNSFVMTARKG